MGGKCDTNCPRPYRPNLFAEEKALLLAFSLSFDDFIITNFNSGIESTFPKFVYVSAARGIPAQANVIGSAMFFIALIIVIVGQVVNRQRKKS
jgi:spermidine/putrescine transport system permease protein